MPLGFIFMPTPFPPLPVTWPSPNEWPVSLKPITNISNAREAVVTSALHGFTAADVGVTVVDFLMIDGMDQILGRPGTITQIVNPNQFAVNINSTDFYLYRSGGFANIVSGLPPFDPYQNLFP